MTIGMAGQRVFVSAGAAGIGRAIAVAFADAGARVRICDVDAAALAALQAERPEIGGALCDVADRPAVEHTMATAIAALGGLDVLVNNAGIGGATAPLEALDPQQWQRVLDVNLTGTFNVTRVAIPALRVSAAGSIIMMSSVAGRMGYPNRSAYATSKWGLIGLTKTLAAELGADRIRVNAILPGAVNGPRYQSVLEGRARQSGRSVEEVAEHAMRSMSIKTLVEPEQIAALALFLASEAAATISGQLFPIDGDTQSLA